MNKKTLIKQHDITNCGAACLASVAAFYKLQLPIARIRQYTSTSTEKEVIFNFEFRILNPDELQYLEGGQSFHTQNFFSFFS